MKKYKLLLFTFLASPFLTACSLQETSGEPLKLWYTHPAGYWTEALPLGNGRLGAMVFGGIGLERIQLNEESLWAGSPVDNNNPQALAHLDEIQRLLLDGQITRATIL